MEYIFGYNKDNQILKTVGSEHTDLTGYTELKRTFSDANIIDTFKVKEKYLSKEDSEGNCYDWYILETHSRYIDYFTPQIGGIKDDFNGQLNDSRDGIMEVYEMASSQLADCNDAIIELYEMIEGGE